MDMNMIYSAIEGIKSQVAAGLRPGTWGLHYSKLRLHQICKSHVTASMHHGTLGLMQSHFYWLIEDPTHHIVMSRPLGATNCFCQQLKIQSFLFIILKGPLLNWYSTMLLTLWTWIQVPWWGLHHMMLFSLKYILSPCSLLHNDPALGGYTGWSFYENKTITSPRLLQAWQPGTWGLHSMEYSVFTSHWDEQHGFL